MDVKGAKALSERLAEAARNVDPNPRESGGLRRGRRRVRGSEEMVPAPRVDDRTRPRRTP